MVIIYATSNLYFFMADELTYKWYKGSIESSEIDNCYFGKILHIPDLISYEGRSIEELMKTFQVAVDDYIKTNERPTTRGRKKGIRKPQLWDTVRIQKKREPWSKDFRIGHLIGDLMWLDCIPTVSTGGILSRKVIQVDEELTAKLNRLDNLWWNECKSRNFDDSALDKKEEEQESWINLQNCYREIEEKYLPKEVTYHVGAYLVEESDMEEIKRGIASALWDTDGCPYSCSKDDIKIVEDSEWFVAITLIYKR
jgi:predicted HicB family RNase H-like nuclease